MAGPPPINSCAKQLQAHPPPRTTHNMLCPLCLLLSGLGQAAAYASGFQPDSTSDQPFVCDYRSLAWEFAKKVQPSHDATLTFDALMLGSLCNQTRPPPAPALPTGLSTAVTNPAGCSIYVSAAHGSDSHDGKTSKTAKATVGAGIEATRKVGGATRTLCVGGGTYYLTGPLSLTAADSGLTIQGEAPGRTWISGATELPKLTWEKYIVAPAVTGSLNALQDTNNQQGCDANSTAPTAAGGVWLLARLDGGAVRSEVPGDGCRRLQVVRVVARSGQRPLERALLHPRRRRVEAFHRLRLQGARLWQVGRRCACQKRLEGDPAGRPPQVASRSAAARGWGAVLARALSRFQPGARVLAPRMGAERADLAAREAP
eukprot:COSAG01_NODE_1866_length_9033_cov_5.018359_3_plen_373_part_00